MGESPPYADQAACSGLNELLDRLAQYDREQDWATLISRYGAFIRRACRSHLPGEAWLDDAVQETLLSLRQDLGRYRSVTDAEASAWLHLIAVRRAQNLMTSESARHRRERSTKEVADSGDTVEDLDEQKERLLQALARLPSDQCALIQLRFFEGLSYDEIGRRLKMSPSAAQRQGHRIVQRLRAMLVPVHRDQQAGFLGLLVLLSSPDLARPPGVSEGLVAGQAGTMGAKVWMLWTGICVLLAGGLGAVIAWRATASDHEPLVKPVEVSAIAQSLDAGFTRSASLAQDLIRRFKERHPDWRLTDYGRRLNDPRLWQVKGGQSQVNAAGSIIDLRLANPGDAIRGAALTLVPGFAVDTQPHLLIARVRMRVRPLHTGIRVEAAWSPAVGNWDGKRYEMALSDEHLRKFPREEDLPPAPEYPDGFYVGLLMDREGCEHLVAVDVLPTSPELTAAVQHKTGTLAVELLCRRCPEPQSCVLSEVQVYAAGSQSTQRSAGSGVP